MVLHSSTSRVTKYLGTSWLQPLPTATSTRRPFSFSLFLLIWKEDTDM